MSLVAKIGVDPEVHELIKAIWQGNYWGPWKSWVKVPEERRTSRWHSFIQQYYWEERFHEEIYFKWKLRTQVTICGRISQKRQKNKQPSYISATDWETILANWSTPEAQAKSQSASVCRCSAPPGLKMHVHVDEGYEGPVSYPDLARKTHTRKDGTFIDERAENRFWRLSKRLKRCYKRDLRVEIAKLTQRLPQQLQSAFS
ncbi:hypothetical protein Bca101_050604 [Brassica carinata]